MELLPLEPWPPPLAELVAEFVVLGEPRTAGSKDSFVPMRGCPAKCERGTLNGVLCVTCGGQGKVPVTRDDGRPKVVTKDSAGVEGEQWRSAVAAAGFNALAGTSDDPLEDPGLLDGVLALDVVFVKPRPKSHYRTGRNAHLLRDTAPSAPNTKPDGLKLRRAVEDALTGVVWVDDARITEGRERKTYGAPARAEVRIFRSPPYAHAGEAIEDAGQESLLAAAG